MIRRLFNNFRRSQNKPDLSIIVVAYDMERELPPTLQSLGRNYQQQVDELRYEVIVVDNGSPNPVSEAQVRRWGDEFRLLRIENAPPSPALAINRGVELARAPVLGILIDGARLVTPGVLHWAQRAFQHRARAVASCIGFHLGPEHQRLAAQRGYSKQVEDHLLRRIGWPENGYRLFEIASLSGSSPAGWSGSISESNCVFLPRNLFDEVGGYEVRFASPGGGMVNLDFYRRICTAPEVELFHIMGEGSFHQIHGGVTTGGGTAKPEFDAQREEYLSIRGAPYSNPHKRPILLGRSTPEATWLLANGANTIVQKNLLAEIRNQHMEAAGLDYRW